MALEAYRSVLRAARVAFQGEIHQNSRPKLCSLLTASTSGDARVLSAARVEARSKFNSYRFLSVDDPEANQKIVEAQEVARLLRQNIVQGKPLVADGEKYRKST